MSDSDPRSLLLVDDDERLRERLARAFRDRGFEVRCAGGHREAVALAGEDSPELAVVDLKMPGPSGLEVVKDLAAIDPTTRIVVLTGYGSIATTLEAVKLGACWYLTKPADADQILEAFDRGRGEPAPPSSEELSVPSLARTEWEHIQRVLADAGGNVSEAARRLGIHRRSLQRKLERRSPQR